MVTLAEATIGVGAGVGNLNTIEQDPNANMKQEISISPVELRATEIAKHIDLLKHIETQLAKYEVDTLTEEQAREIVQSLLVEIHGGKINIDQNTLEETLQTNTGWRQWARDRAGDIWRTGQNIYENLDHKGLDFLTYDQEDELLDNIFLGLGISQEDPRDPTNTLSRGVQMANLAKLLELADQSRKGGLLDDAGEVLKEKEDGDRNLTLPESLTERLTYRNILSAIVTNSYVSLDGEFEGVATELEKLAKVEDPAEYKFQDNSVAYSFLGELEAAYAVISTLNFNFSKLGEPDFGESQATEEELDGLEDNSFAAVWKGGEGFLSRLNHLLGEEEGVSASVERSNIGKIRNLEIISSIDESLPDGQQVSKDQDTETDEDETVTASEEEGVGEQGDTASQGPSDDQELSEEEGVEGSTLTLNLASIQTMLANGYIGSYESYQQYYQQVEDDLAAYWKARSGKIQKINDEITRINAENRETNKDGVPPIYTVVVERLLLSTPKAANETVSESIGSVSDRSDQYFVDATIKLNYGEIYEQVKSHSKAEASKLVPLLIIGTQTSTQTSSVALPQPEAPTAATAIAPTTPAAKEVRPLGPRVPEDAAPQLPPVPQT